MVPVVVAVVVLGGVDFDWQCQADICALVTA